MRARAAERPICSPGAWVVVRAGEVMAPRVGDETTPTTDTSRGASRPRARRPGSRPSRLGAGLAGDGEGLQAAGPHGPLVAEASAHRWAVAGGGLGRRAADEGDPAVPEAVQRLDGVVDGALEVDVDVGDAGGSGGAPHHDEGADEALADARLLQGPHGQGVALLGGPLLGAADDLEDGLPHGRVEAGEGHGQGAGAAAGQAAAMALGW